MRIDAPGVTAGPTVATIVSASSDSLVIASPDLAPLAIARSSIGTLEFSQGRDRWAGTKHGTLLGVEWGAGLGLLAAVAGKDCKGLGDQRRCESLTGDERAAVLGLCVYAGAFYGAIIGAIASRESWAPLDLASHASINVRDGRPVLSFSRSF